MDESTLGKRLTKLRKAAGLKQSDVASQSGVSRKAISHYENDEREPGITTLLKLCDLFHVSIDYLTGTDSRRMIDGSDLTDHQFGLISDLVEDISEENRGSKS